MPGEDGEGGAGRFPVSKRPREGESGWEMPPGVKKPLSAAGREESRGSGAGLGRAGRAEAVGWGGRSGSVLN